MSLEAHLDFDKLSSVAIHVELHGPMIWGMMRSSCYMHEVMLLMVWHVFDEGFMNSRIYEVIVMFFLA